MTRREQVMGLIGLVIAFFAGLVIVNGPIQSAALGLVIASFALGRNRARKEAGRGFGRYFGEVLGYGLVVGLAAMFGTGIARVA